jgi:hypothetical protein
MISVVNLKSAQMIKLCGTLHSSIMQNLGIFGAMEGICFKFTSLN